MTAALLLRVLLAMVAVGPFRGPPHMVVGQSVVFVPGGYGAYMVVLQSGSGLPGSGGRLRLVLP